MSGDAAWQRVVLDDADLIDRLGAVTISELRAQQVEEVKRTLAPFLAAIFRDMQTTTAEGRDAIATGVVAVTMTALETNIERIRLRLQGREPLH